MLFYLRLKESMTQSWISKTRWENARFQKTSLREQMKLTFSRRKSTESPMTSSISKSNMPKTPDFQPK